MEIKSVRVPDGTTTYVNLPADAVCSWESYKLGLVWLVYVPNKVVRSSRYYRSRSRRIQRATGDGRRS